MGLPYERQILRLLQELSHYQVVVRHCRQEKRNIQRSLRKHAERLSRLCMKWKKNNRQCYRKICS